MAGNIEPITFDEVAHINEPVHEEIIDTVNQLIKQNFNYVLKESTVKIKDIFSNLKEKNFHYSATEILERGWLDIERLYENAGWYVRYYSPSHNDVFEPYFYFSQNN